jgi:hypothetical protein
VLNTAHFCDEVRRKTVETRIQLSRLLGSFLHRNDLRICDRFAKFALVGQDHIVAEFGQVEDSYVRRCIAQVARTTQFMDATGLKPNTDEIYGFPTFSKEQRLPGQVRISEIPDSDYAKSRTAGSIRLFEARPRALWRIAAGPSA